MLDAAIGTVADLGTLTLYNAPQPAAGGGTATTPLAVLTMNADAFPAADGGVLTANAITDGTATGTDTATWFRLSDVSANVLLDGSVGTSGADLNLNDVAITSGGTVSVTSFTITHPLL
jgi:hypothetical protein